MSEWYVSRNGEQYGPYTWEEMLKITGDGNVAESDLVWSAALNEWQEAGKVPGLFAAMEPAGDQGLKRSEASPGEKPVDATAPGSKKAGRSRRSLYLYASLAAVVLVVGAVIFFAGGENGKDQVLFDESAPALDLAAIFEPENAAVALESRLRNSLELDEVIVTYDHSNHTVRVQFEHPHDMNTHHLMILYLAVLVAAENYLPYSQRVEMHMALDGVPFLALCVGVESLRAFINGEVERDHFYRSLEVTVPGTSSVIKEATV